MSISQADAACLISSIGCWSIAGSATREAARDVASARVAECDSRSKVFASGERDRGDRIGDFEIEKWGEGCETQGASIKYAPEMFRRVRCDVVIFGGGGTASAA